MDLFSNKQEYGKKEVFLLLFLLVPTIVAWTTMYFWRDAVITLGALVGTYYGLSVVYDKAIYDFKWDYYIGKDMVDLSKKIVAGKLKITDLLSHPNNDRSCSCYIFRFGSIL